MNAFPPPIHGQNEPHPAAHALTRRQFLTGLAGAAAFGSAVRAVDAATQAATEKNAAGIPVRMLGRTGEKVTIVGLGTAPVGHSMPGADKGVPVYRAALEAGVNYIDTAHGYDDAEEYLGQLIPQYRDRMFLVTKSLPSGPDPRAAAAEMQRQFERSLRRMKTDHVDLLHIHSVGSHPEELILGAGGALEFVRKMKQQGQTRFIGITAHSRPGRLVKIIETGEIDAVMVALNFADYHTYRFEQEVLPVARRHRCGILAMKVFGGHRGGFAGYKQPGPAKMPAEFLESALRYALSIESVSGAVLGAYTVQEVLEHVAWAKQFQPLTPEQHALQREQGKPLAAEWGTHFGPVA
jgi:predicted aldo/keto reductase-like oxidoreductase